MMARYAAHTDTEIWGLGYTAHDAREDAAEESGADEARTLRVSRITPALAYEVIQHGSPFEWAVRSDGVLTLHTDN